MCVIKYGLCSQHNYISSVQFRMPKVMTTEGMKKRNDILKIWTLIATNLHFSSPQDAKSHGQSWKYAGAYGVGAGLFGGVYAAAPGAVVANIAHAAPTVAALPAPEEAAERKRRDADEDA